MAKSLKTLSRIQKFNIDEKRKALAVLADEEEKATKRLAKLNADFEMEKEFAAQNDSPSFGAYLENYLDVRESLENKIKDLGVKIEQAKDEITAMYKEQKTYDIVDENRRKHQQKEDDLKDQKAIDEIGTNKYIKSKKLK